LPQTADRASPTNRLSEVSSKASQRPLLVVDGDSLAHRAYHGLPKSISRAGGRPAGAITGFANFLLRLWQSERPRAVIVGWDTLEAPTYRHDALPGYQAGRVFDDALLEQLAVLHELVETFGFRTARAAGYEADDFLAAAAQAEEARGGEALVVTSDRDAFQLAAEHTTILRPVRGVSVLDRVGPAEVRETYGVEPAQVPDFIALRGDPSDRIAGAKGVGAKTAAAVLTEYGSLEAALEAGRFSNQAEELRLYRRIATLDASAPLPSLNDQAPKWAEASDRVRGWGMNALADRLAAATG
jgi:DNA polymerase I